MRTRALAFALLLGLAGCETVSERPGIRVDRPAAPIAQGTSHTVQPGETLWRIARSYGLTVATLAAANQLPETNRLAVGTTLFVPLPPESRRFTWPVCGTPETGGGNAVEIAAPMGSVARAARSGRVAVATDALSGWGKTVILDHADGYLTIYAGLGEILVTPGASLRQGVPVGTLGAQELHFEIRYGTSQKNTLALLPQI